jgi:hypothetical protein
MDKFQDFSHLMKAYRAVQDHTWDYEIDVWFTHYIAALNMQHGELDNIPEDLRVYQTKYARALTECFTNAVKKRLKELEIVVE